VLKKYADFWTKHYQTATNQDQTQGRKYLTAQRELIYFKITLWAQVSFYFG